MADGASNSSVAVPPLGIRKGKQLLSSIRPNVKYFFLSSRQKKNVVKWFGITFPKWEPQFHSYERQNTRNA